MPWKVSSELDASVEALDSKESNRGSDDEVAVIQQLSQQRRSLSRGLRGKYGSGPWLCLLWKKRAIIPHCSSDSRHGKLAASNFDCS